MLNSVWIVLAMTIAAGNAGAECPPVLSKDANYLSALQSQDIRDGAVAGAPRALAIPQGKVTAVRLFATWCPYCKRDMKQLNDVLGTSLDQDKLDTLLVVFKSRLETEATLKKFMLEGLAQLGVKAQRFDFRHVQMTGAEMKAVKGADGSLLFPEFLGVPYALVFDKKGQLRFRGNFTADEKTIKQHYDMIQSLVNGSC